MDPVRSNLSPLIEKAVSMQKNSSLSLRRDDFRMRKQ
jgi:hypothetical protein